MSRIGKQPIPVPDTVTVAIEPDVVRVTGPRGDLFERVSRPGRRRYVGAQEVPKVLGGMGTTIISTSRGVMTGHQARREGVGGEVVAEVW